MEELCRIFKLPVLVDAHSGVRRLTGYVLEEGVHADALHVLAMAFEGLHFLEFGRRLDRP